MNCISFRLVHDSGHKGHNLVAISIDGHDLIELVRAYELPYARSEGHENIAGGYAYLTAALARPPSRHFWGDPAEDDQCYDNKLALAECECGCPGCWPLVCEIVLEDDGAVVWRNFEQPHRRPDSAAGWWDYSGFGPFRFALKEYERALCAVAG